MGDADLEMVLKWRIRPEVSLNMLTDIDDDLEKQRSWFARIKTSGTAEYWIIEHDATPIGVLNLAEIDRENRRASWGFYIAEKKNWPLGAMVPMYFYNYVFKRKDLRLHKLHGAVLDGNKNIMKMHTLCGYRQVGVYRDHVYRQNKFHDVYLVELLREDWIAHGEKFKRYVADFE